MCGIAGIIGKNQNIVDLPKLKAMADTIAHRGPDGEGFWISNNKNVGLAHRRLAIIDLSTQANQPMHYLDRYTLVFNGEIYNYLELKKDLIAHGFTFQTESDTEVLIALYHKYKDQCLSYLDGMFAFVLYDKVENSIFCARDRFGEKPFFYNYKQGEYFYFGSEMKCLWAAGVSKDINKTMLFNYLNFGIRQNIDQPQDTFYKDCKRLIHGHFIKIDVASMSIKIQKYYSLNYNLCNENISLEEVSNKFRDLFYLSINRRLRSDVAIGSSLSGGLDSSLIVCVIDAIKKGNTQNTFSAIFPGFKKDEKKYIDFVTKATSVNAHFTTPAENGFIDNFEKLIWHQEEPFASASIYAQYCVMQLARENNTIVLLDGQGADEILGGYHQFYFPYFKELKRNNFALYQNQFKGYKDLHLGNQINGIEKRNNGDLIRAISPKLVTPVKKIKSFINQIKSPILSKDFYNEHKQNVFETIGNNAKTLNEALYSNTFVDGLQDLLRYADRNSMAHSVEVRLPFLNHELVEFLFLLPATFKINNGWTKWILRETFKKTLPNEIAWRKDKIGFEPPQQNWMKSKVFQDKIIESKEILINEGVYNINVLEKNTSASENWQALMSAAIFLK